MDPIPTPFQRLLNLERDLEQLKASRVPKTAISQDQPHPLPPRHIWPADELLLSRLLRRSPQAIEAYQGHAELTSTEKHGMRLAPSDTTSAYQFCEMIDGDAVVWLASSSIPLAWGTSSFGALFHSPADLETPRNLVLQTLPLFKPIARGQAWTLHRKGEMSVQFRPFPEQAEQAMLLRRLETLDRRFSQLRLQLEAEIKDLRSQLLIQQTQIQRLLSLLPTDPHGPF